MRKMKTVVERFWAKINKGPSCWFWTGTKDCYGYGVMTVGRKPSGALKTHRASWAIHNGPIPKGLWVLHKCDNPPCVNPDHLFLGTNADNMADMMAKGRSARGEKNGRSKLKEADVRAIRRLRQRRVGLRVIAREFGISLVAVSKLCTGKTWNSVLDWPHCTPGGPSLAST